jgi:hypothetical protein
MSPYGLTGGYQSFTEYAASIYSYEDGGSLFLQVYKITWCHSPLNRILNFHCPKNMNLINAITANQIKRLLTTS